MPRNETLRSVDDRIWQLKVTLTDTRPPIWRRIQVPGSITLYKLHQLIQIIMPWQSYHLYEFQVGEQLYGDPDPVEDDFYERHVKSARRIKLSQVLPEPDAKLTYVYDFGDNWEHSVVVEKILSPEPGVHYPICLKGVRAAPPEDVGGVWGYEDFLAAVRDPSHEEHEHMLEWAGGEWDPNRFDLDRVNWSLQHLRPRARSKAER